MTLQTDITRLVIKPAPEKKLDAAQTPPSIVAKTGLNSSRSGIQSEEVMVQSTDGVFTFIVRVITE